ncbi:hypothetical protein FA15DRAFT_664475 [Coprinopsis marcescibilis]|uniref:RING-CH-type domain-containing protein n=1 Tax=Coprinopsis marcescibilis TaxID=230819 RepID=A0A5C3L919_COPMA|nr:hypothetical protein FA15DRAFT_664475 [Coprinopsis marcescibilis]
MSSMSGSSRVPIPTIDDLRVKLCYICHEEEVYDAPVENPPKVWTHPCQCTLVAHESCLLKWIQSSQASESRASKALKCPQCGAQYELESYNPWIFKVIQAGNRALKKAGSLFLVFGTAAIFGVIGTSFYVICTGYGAWAVQRFMGKEMFNLCLGEDPSNWPWSAYLNLPLIPFSLILTRFQSLKLLSPGIPLILAWPGAFNITNRSVEYWRLPENARRLVGTAASSPAARSWPPSPLLFGLFGLPIIRMFYQSIYNKVYTKLMGQGPPQMNDILQRRRPRDGARVNIGNNFVIRLRADIGEANNQGANANAGEANVDGANNNQNNNVGDNNFDVNQDIAGAAEELIEVNTSSIGRKIGGALLIPAISSFMGDILLRLSGHSPILRRILAVRNPVGGVWVPPPVNIQNWHTMGPMKQMGTAVEVVFRSLWGSAHTLAESDPVWWRNTIGLGIFIVVKDAVKLLHLYLQKRELESRKVKNRDFNGIDLKALDLVPEFLARLPRATA